MTVNDVLEKLYKINKILNHIDVHGSVANNEVDDLSDILEDYKAMLGAMKIKE